MSSNLMNVTYYQYAVVALCCGAPLLLATQIQGIKLGLALPWQRGGAHQIHVDLLSDFVRSNTKNNATLGAFTVAPRSQGFQSICGAVLSNFIN